MYFSDVIYLLQERETPTGAGQPSIKQTRHRGVWANRKEAGMTEFYKAAAVGKKLTAVFEVHAEDYAGEMLVEYNGQLYDVERSYRTGAGVVELSCTDAKREKTGGPVA